MERRVPFWRGLWNLVLGLVRLLPSPGLWLSLALLAVLAWAALNYAEGSVPISLVVDGTARRMRTHCDTVGKVLDDVAVEVRETDLVTPARDAAVYPGLEIVVQHARPVTLVADGTTRTLYTHARQVGEVLEEAGLSLKPGDLLWADGEAVPGEAPVTLQDGGSEGLRPARSSRRLTSEASAPPVSHVRVRRATVIHIQDGTIDQTVRTTARTVGEALHDARTVLYVGDLVHPDLNTPVATGLRVRIERGTPVTVLADGRSVRTRTHRETVGEVLAELGIVLVGRDLCTPGPDESLHDGIQVWVSRIREEQVTEEEQIPFETKWTPDPTLELDHRRVDAAGVNGVKRRRYRVVYQDGVQVEQRLEDEWIAREPQEREIAYGTRIVVRTLETPDGPIEYWRRMHVFMTSYTEATCGKTPDHPWYAMTKIGWRVRRGIIAVDPRVINMLTEMYVPGYGHGIAADTGGLIIGRHIDLAHEVDDFDWWFEWNYVYLLTPPPPPSEIRWVLPDFPRGRWP